MGRIFPALIILLFAAAQSAVAAEGDDIFHSELPLWGDYPNDNDLLATGTWRVGAPSCERCLATWMSFGFLGPTHPSFYVWEAAEERAALRSVRPQPSAFVRLDGEQNPSLFVLQIGFRPGSRYLLLTADAGKPIKHLSVLDAQCDGVFGAHRVHARVPTANFITGYCAVESREALRQLARAALNRPPRAILEWTEGR
jgi:hypothetical protein